MANEREILTSLYHSLNGDDWSVTNYWCSERPLNEWGFITINPEGDVTYLDLSVIGYRTLINDALLYNSS